MIPITLSNVSYSYPNGVPALDSLSLTIVPGECIALVGQNGAGKTTLARHLNGLLRPTAGTVMIGDWDTRAYTVARLAERVGYVFQHPEHQLFKRTIRDEVAFGPHNLGFEPARVTEAVAAALHETHLTLLADRHPHDLHSALRKQVALASVLAMETPIVVLDEPTAGQDAQGVQLIGAICDKLYAAGRTVIVISHDLDFCADHCERFIVLQAGQVLIDDLPEVVFARPDLLAQSAIEPPQFVRLAHRLGLPPLWQIEPLLDALAEQHPRAAR